jgi:hypothetical protein
MMQLGEIFIVARYNPQLYEYLQREFSHDARIRIIMDRRVGERRQRTEAATGERRQSDRRQHIDVDAHLRERGRGDRPRRQWAFVIFFRCAR